MLTAIKMMGVSMILHLILAQLGGKLPSNEDIARVLATPECVFHTIWEHTRGRHLNFATDPRYDDPDQQAGKAIVFQAPHQRITRAFQVMDTCRRYEIMREMMKNGFIPGRVRDQPDPPPPDPACHLEKARIRVWNVRNLASITVNDVPMFSVKSGTSGINQVEQQWQAWVHSDQPGDSGWQDITEALKPGWNTVGIEVANAGIPDGFLGFGTKPSQPTLTAQVVKNDGPSSPGGLYWNPTFQPRDRVGWMRLPSGHLYVNVICDK